VSAVQDEEESSSAESSSMTEDSDIDDHKGASGSEIGRGSPKFEDSGDDKIQDISII
jgi:hypothetical protein